MATGETKSKWSGELPGVISEARSKVHLAYENKVDERVILSKTPADTVSLWKPNMNTRDNRLYYGDNAGILTMLMYDLSVKEKVDLIYIDPPFATNSVFKSRSRRDAYEDLQTGGRYIEFLRTRLIMLRELLSEQGSIYVHLDKNMIFHIKIVMDEVFGSANFRAFITRRKSNPKNYTRNTYGNVSDYILFYTKSDNYIWNRSYRAWAPDRAEQEYPYVEENTGRRFKKVPIHAPGERNGDTGKPWRGMNPPRGKHWQYRRSTLDEMDARGEIYWSQNGNPRRKVYFDESKGVPVQDIWMDVKDPHNQNIRITGYPTEKPFQLLERIICASSNADSLVLDCFSGSGTTLDVASTTGRRWIGIDKSAEAIQTTLRRFRDGLQPMGDYVTGKHEAQQQQLPFEFVELDNDSRVAMHSFSLFATVPYKGDLDLEIGQTLQE